MRFNYSASNSMGKRENGQIEADAESTAKSEIRDRGLYLISIKETDEQGNSRNLRF